MAVVMAGMRESHSLKGKQANESLDHMSIGVNVEADVPEDHAEHLL
jgi:hypothetical protein